MIWAKKHKGIVFFVFTIVLFALCKLIPRLAEIYHQTFFALWRIAWDYTLAHLPFAFFPVAVLLLLFTLWKWRQQWLDILSIWAASFFWLWGFHYALPVRIPVNPMFETLDPERLYKAVLLANDSTQCYLQEANDALSKCPTDPNYVQREQLEVELISRGLSIHGKPVVKSSGEFDLLRKIGIGGIYMPYASEGYFDGSFLPERQVFVMHHEMCHAYGIADEGECDFIAFCALRKGDPLNPLANAVVRYAAWLELYISLRSELLSHYPEAKSRIDSFQNPLLAAKMEELRQNATQHEAWIPGAASQVNHGYLNALGVRGGIKSYDRLITLFMQENWHFFETKPDSLRGNH